MNFLDENKALACIHCGLCLSACPTYLETGDENNSPRGRIYLMRALEGGALPLAELPVQHLDLCLGCRACEAACPSGVLYGELIEATREHVATHYQRSVFQTFLRRVAIEQLFPFPWRMKLALALTKVLPRRLFPPLQLLPKHYRSVRLPELSPVGGKKRAGFIQGCVQSVMFGDTNVATLQLLQRAGYDVITPHDQGCCGALDAHTGNLGRARAFARQNIAAFGRFDLDIIVINAAGCGSTLKEYGILLRDDPAWATRAKEFSAKVRDLTEVLQPASFNAHPSVKVTYHDACHLAHAQRITKQPRDLVRAVAGAQFVDLPESDVCCGSAGSYNLTEPAMADRLQQRKINNILKTGAEIVVTSNPGCILQLQAGLRKAGASKIRVLHLADFLLESIR